MKWQLVLLDRDGTINRSPVKGRYITHPVDAVLLPGAAAAVRALNSAGVPVVVVTNQRGIATGALTEAELERVHVRLDEVLAAEDAHIDAWYVCPHDVGQCDCRKPLPGLLARALADYSVTDPRACVVIGDSESDMAAGRALGLRSLIVGADRQGPTSADAVHTSLLDAVSWLLGTVV